MGGGAEAQEATRALALPSPVLSKLASSAVKDARASCGSGKFLLGSSTSPEDLCLPRVSSYPALLGEEGGERRPRKREGPCPTERWFGCGLFGWVQDPALPVRRLPCASVPSFVPCG